MEHDNEKEVYFNQYCPTCLYSKQPEEQYPCEECLSYPSNSYSHKPVKWEVKK